MALTASLPSYRAVRVAVDADIVAFRAAYIGESGHSPGLAISVAEEMLDTIATNLKVSGDSMNRYFTSSHNYRTIIDPGYKAQRRDKPKPKYLKAVREHMMKHPRAISIEHHEADDLVVYGDIIASVDKDLLQLPGLHYNITSQSVTRVSDVDAEWYLLSQVLTGDSTDNIKGIKGVGPAKAKRFLSNIDPLITLEEKLALIRDFYLEKGHTQEDFFKCLNSVYVQRRGDFSLWTHGHWGNIILSMTEAYTKRDISALKMFVEDIVAQNAETTTQD